MVGLAQTLPFREVICFPPMEWSAAYERKDTMLLERKALADRQIINAAISRMGKRAMIGKRLGEVKRTQIKQMTNSLEFVVEATPAAIAAMPDMEKVLITHLW